MNIRKNIDYSTMFDAMRVAMSTDMSQTKLYYELGRPICQRTEKGAAGAAAEYLQQNYPDVPGLSPRNLRRMRDFYRMYEENLELLDLAMDIGWTQNVVILESDLNMEERRWYLCAVKQFGWSKAALQQKIEAQAHQKVCLDETENQYNPECKIDENEGFREDNLFATNISYRTDWNNHPDSQHSRLNTCIIQIVLTPHWPIQQTGPPVHMSRISYIKSLL